MRWGALKMETETVLPAELPKSAAECRTLGVFRTLLKGESQAQVAERGRVKQSRISEIEIGKVIPRRKHWATLMVAWGLGPDAESHFYRMIQNARIDRNRAEALKRPASEDVPLIAAARTDGEVIGQQQGCESEGRVAG